MIKSYDIKLFSLGPDGEHTSLKYHDAGVSAPPEAITLDGFSQDICIDLSAYWADILQQRLEHLHTQITTRETIIKFGDTQQLLDEYEIIFETAFSGN